MSGTIQSARCAGIGISAGWHVGDGICRFAIRVPSAAEPLILLLDLLQRVSRQKTDFAVWVAESAGQSWNSFPSPRAQ